jgi:hypothetical protein
MRRATAFAPGGVGKMDRKSCLRGLPFGLVCFPSSVGSELTEQARCFGGLGRVPCAEKEYRPEPQQEVLRAGAKMRFFSWVAKETGMEGVSPSVNNVEMDFSRRGKSRNRD